MLVTSIEKTATYTPVPRILIVEDDSVVAMIAQAMATSLGAEIEVAHDGMEALNAFQEDTFDLVLMDLEMPVMGGYETVYEMRQMEYQQLLKPTPIVAVTGTLSPTIYARCMHVGMNGCVMKPYTQELIQRLIAQYIEGHALGYENEQFRLAAN